MKTLLNFRKHVSVIIVLGFLFTACQKDLSDSTTSEVQSKANHSQISEANKVTTTTTCFSAIAQVDECAGEWIRFSGMIEMKENVTVDGSGKTHISRHFIVQDLTGVGVTVGSTLTAMTCEGTLLNGTTTGTTYEVLGGAEMFNIHFGEGQNATLNGSNTFIHRGTLVFKNNATGQRVIAKHVIRKVNGVLMENTWECSGSKL